MESDEVNTNNGKSLNSTKHGFAYVSGSSYTFGRDVYTDYTFFQMFSVTKALFEHFRKEFIVNP